MLETLKIMTSDLEVGMFISALDRPWLETPFLIQGFRLETREQIDALQKHCEYVLIDTRQSRQKPDALQRKVRTERRRVELASIFKDRALQTYEDDSEFVEETPRAVHALGSLLIDIDDIFGQVKEKGRFNAIQLKKSVDPIIDSISRNPDACLWIARMKQHDKYTYQHSLGASIWAVSMGRQLGLPKHDLRSLGMGAMLMDVGKLRLAPELLQADDALTPDQADQMRSHVAHGLEIVEESGIINPDIINMVGYHHERYDGSGYPHGLARDEIPPVARIAAIVDAYDAMTSRRSYAQALSPSHAIKQLYEARDSSFQAELVEAFIQAIGIYPPGSLVELSSGEVGVVVAEARTRRLRPRVLILLDVDKNPIPHPKTVDLQAQQDEASPMACTIVRGLDPEAYDVDLSTIDVYTEAHPAA